MGVTDIDMLIDAFNDAGFVVEADIKQRAQSSTTRGVVKESYTIYSDGEDVSIAIIPKALSIDLLASVEDFRYDMVGICSTTQTVAPLDRVETTNHVYSVLSILTIGTRYKILKLKEVQAHD